MVQVLLEGLAEPAGEGETRRVSCIHVNARYSTDLEDVGTFRPGKVAALFRYCARAIMLRFRHGVRTIYFVPSPPRRVPLFRDMLALLLLRPFFPRVIFHWHAAGLGGWLDTQPVWLRAPTRFLLGGADMSIALAALSEPDARKLRPARSVVVHYGIADLFPDFATSLGPRRAARARELAATLSADARSTVRVRVLFMALCTREKGLFDAMTAVANANAVLAAQGNAARFELHVAGGFPDDRERAEADALVAAPEWRGLWHYHGFVSGEPKRRLLEDADLMLFPTFYAAESFPIVILEAMCAGLPIIATRHRAIPEMLPADYPHLVEPHDVAAMSAELPAAAAGAPGAGLRERYLAHFTREQYVTGMRDAILEVAAR
jgi:glycosyltransferase involved in cell wall biosynthesis